MKFLLIVIFAYQVKQGGFCADLRITGLLLNRKGKKMLQLQEKQVEKPLRYSWPVWFAENFNDTLNQGQMVDISSRTATFNCHPDISPFHGQSITARFSIPRYDEDGSFDLENFIRSGNVSHIEHSSPFTHTVKVEFAEELPFWPGQQQITL